MRHERGGWQFSTCIRLFLNACPGPPLLKKALRLAALQQMAGVPGLGVDSGGIGWEDGKYLASVADVAGRMKVRPDYLTRAALRRGFSLSRALRWVRFLHAVALLAEGHRVAAVAWTLGFSDAAGWSRFSRRLLGRSYHQFPSLPLEYWVRMALDDVFSAPPYSPSPTPTPTATAIATSPSASSPR